MMKWREMALLGAKKTENPAERPSRGPFRSGGTGNPLRKVNNRPSFSIAQTRAVSVIFSNTHKSVGYLNFYKKFEKI
jgi:hypothetical protein